MISYRIVAALGLLMLPAVGAAIWLGDLRAGTKTFLVIYFGGWALYAGAVVLVLRLEHVRPPRWFLPAVFIVALAAHGLLVFTRPTLSDDMYRYVWEGKIQWRGYSPYVTPPDSPELVDLRDEAVWPSVNRKDAVTVYPPGALIIFAGLARIWPDNVHWFQAAFSAAAIGAGLLLMGLLRSLGRSPVRVLVFLWAPLLAFEAAHAAHLDALVLPLLVGAWWARVRERDAMAGGLLGIAAVIKFFPLLLLPILWRPRDKRGRWAMPVAFVAVVALSYLPYVLANGTAVIGFLPDYLREEFNVNPLAQVLSSGFSAIGVDDKAGILGLIVTATLAISIYSIARPARDGEDAVRRGLWPLGAYILLTYNLFPWYVLWIPALAAIFLKPGGIPGLKLDAWTGWWLFSGISTLAYTYFVSWKPVQPAIWLEFGPLYAFLLVALWRMWPWRAASVPGLPEETARA